MSFRYQSLIHVDCLTYWGPDMLDSLTLTALLPTRSYDNEIPVPKMRSKAQLVRKRKRRSNPTVPLWADEVSVSGTRGRSYCSALRSASAGCDITCKGHQDSSVSNCGTEHVSEKHPYWGDRRSNWIEGQGNGITSSHPYGKRTTRKS